MTLKAYWRYRCDHGHEWTLFRDELEEEVDEDRVCPYGHPAVTLSKERAVNDTQVTFRPAGRIVDPVKGQEILRGRYFVVISDMDQSVELVSESTYTWKLVV